MKRTADLASLLLLGGMWGASYLFIKIVVADVPPLTLVSGRLLVASVLMWLLVAVTRQPIPRTRSTWSIFAVLGLINTALPFTLITWGEQYISSGMASLLLATMPLFAVILAQVLGHDKATLGRIAGVLLGFVGVLVVLIPDLRQGHPSDIAGQIAMVAAGACYASGATLASRKLRGVAPLVTAAGQLSTAAVYVVPLSLLLERPFHLTPSPAALGSWAALALLGTFLAYIVYFGLLQRSTATLVSTVSYLIPVVSVLLGVVVLREPVTSFLVIGFVLILLGVTLVRS